MPTGNLVVYNLGTFGVNLVDGPIHMKDGELLQCQNAVNEPSDAESALKKRPGMTKVNATTASGTIVAIVNIPLDDPTP